MKALRRASGPAHELRILSASLLLLLLAVFASAGVKADTLDVSLNGNGTVTGGK
jgi:hypothetical protein